jgi:hypothetical protein
MNTTSPLSASADVKYCRDKAFECEARAQVSKSKDVSTAYRTLAARWLEFAKKAEQGNLIRR